MTTLTKGEQNALKKVYIVLGGDVQRQHHYAPPRTQFRTMQSLYHKGMLTYSSGPYGGDRWQLTQEGATCAAELIANDPQYT